MHAVGDLLGGAGVVPNAGFVQHPFGTIKQWMNQGADTDEAGHAFQSEAGHLYRSEAGHRSDLMSATGGLLPRIWVDDVSGGWIGQERVDFRAPNVAFAGFRR